MKFRRLLIESYKTELMRKLIQKGIEADFVERYADMYIDYPKDEVIDEILRDEKNLDPYELNLFKLIMQEARGIKKKIKPKKKKYNFGKIIFPEEKITKKISSQLINEEIEVKIPQYQLEMVLKVLGTTPRILVDLDKIPYINGIRFDVRKFYSKSKKISTQYTVKLLADENNVYTGIVEVIIDSELYAEACHRADETVNNEFAVTRADRLLEAKIYADELGLFQ